MDEVPILLLIALALVFVAWRATRAQNRTAAALRAEEQARNTFTLEPRQAPGGQGFDVVDADGHVVDVRALRFDDHGLEAVAVHGFRPERDAGGGPGFAAGLPVEIIRSDEEPGRLEVWNSAMTHRAGELPRHLAHFFEADAAPGVSDCLVLWEDLDGARRTGLLVLLIREDMHFAD
jgi:hypothetical protein